MDREVVWTWAAAHDLDRIGEYISAGAVLAVEGARQFNQPARRVRELNLSRRPPIG